MKKNIFITVEGDEITSVVGTEDLQDVAVIIIELDGGKDTFLGDDCTVIHDMVEHIDDGDVSEFEKLISKWKEVIK